jgi:chromosome segregation ATPase
MAESAAAMGTVNLEAELSDLKKKLEKLEKDLSKMTKDRDALKADLTALEKIVNEINQTASTYGQSLPELNKEKEFYQQYFNTKYQMVTGAIEEIQEEVDKKIDAIDQEISSKLANVGQSEENVKTAIAELDAAKKDLDEKQGGYDLLKGQQKEIGAKLQKMKDLRKTIEGLDDNNDSKGMYVYLLELKKVLDKTQIYPTSEYENQLEQAWSALNSARESVRKEQSECDEAKNLLAGAQAELKNLQDNRIKNILESLKNLG